MLNQPLMAFTAPKHEGEMGNSFSFASVNTPCVAVKALKKSESTDEYIIRLYELTGVDQSDVKVTFAADIASAREVNGVEEDLPDARSVATDGKTMTFSIGHYQPKTFAVRLASPALQAPEAKPASTFVTLEYDTDMMSGHEAMTDATAGIAKAFPAELLSDELTVNDITFAIGSRERRATTTPSVATARPSSSTAPTIRTNSTSSPSPPRRRARKPTSQSTACPSPSMCPTTAAMWVRPRQPSTSAQSIAATKWPSQPLTATT